MVILEAWETWTVTIGDDLRVRCSRRSIRRWAQAMIDSHEPPSQYIPDLAYYHASRLAEYPGWRITKADPPEAVRGVVY